MKKKYISPIAEVLEVNGLTECLTSYSDVPIGGPGTPAAKLGSFDLSDDDAGCANLGFNWYDID